MTQLPLSILYQDDYLVAINKPHGLLVHRSSIAADATEFALQQLRDQLGRKVYLTHRIDRKTAGVLLFALDSETNSLVSQGFRDRKVDKSYLAVVRGWLPDDSGVVNHPLTNEAGNSQEAVTRYSCVERVELKVPYGRYDTSRYTLIRAYPETGRMHQIRRHLNHLRYPIVGDRPHGCSKQNKLWKQKWNMLDMMLHAERLSFQHPISKKTIVISAPLSPEFSRVLNILGIDHQKLLKNDP